MDCSRIRLIWIDTARGHYAVVFKTKKKHNSSIQYLEDIDLNILFFEDEAGDLCFFKAGWKIYKLNCHKSREQLLAAYHNAGWMSPKLVNMITQVVNKCKDFQMFSKSVARPRVTLPQSTSFNETVTLDLISLGLTKCCG